MPFILLFFFSVTLQICMTFLFFAPLLNVKYTYKFYPMTFGHYVALKLPYILTYFFSRVLMQFIPENNSYRNDPKHYCDGVSLRFSVFVIKEKSAKKKGIRTLYRSLWFKTSMKLFSFFLFIVSTCTELKVWQIQQINCCLSKKTVSFLFEIMLTNFRCSMKISIVKKRKFKTEPWNITANQQKKQNNKFEWFAKVPRLAFQQILKCT